MGSVGPVPRPVRSVDLATGSIGTAAPFVEDGTVAEPSRTMEVSPAVVPAAPLASPTGPAESLPQATSSSTAADHGSVLGAVLRREAVVMVDLIRCGRNPTRGAGRVGLLSGTVSQKPELLKPNTGTERFSDCPSHAGVSRQVKGALTDPLQRAPQTSPHDVSHPLRRVRKGAARCGRHAADTPTQRPGRRRKR